MKDLIKQLVREELTSHDIDRMLNSIKSTDCDCCKYFDMEDMSNYGGMEHPVYFIIEKRVIFELIFMDPKQYIYAIANGFGGLSYEDVMGGAYDDEKAKRYAEDMKGGAKFPIGYYVDGKADQEGRHRAAAGMMLGCKQIPVIKKVVISDKYVRNFVGEYKDLSREQLDTMFKEKGYHGISGLDWRTFQSYINYRL